MDLATLGIAIDSRQVEGGKQSLDEFTRSADKAEQAAEKVGEGAKKGSKGVKDLGDSLTEATVKGNLIAQQIQKGVDQAIESVKQLYALMSEVGDYQDLADMTGAAAVNIAKMQTSADVAGVSMTSLAGYMNQMTRVLASTDEESDKAAKALNRVGLNYKDFLNADPADRMNMLAKAMAQYGDEAGKTEVLQALFGRGAKDVAKVLKELGDETSYSTRLTQEMIEAQDAVNDATAKTLSQTRQYIQYMLVGAAPAINAFKGALLDTVAAALGMNDASTDLASNQGVKEFALGAARVIAMVIDVFQAAYRVVEAFVRGLKAVDDAFSALAKGQGVSAALDAFDAGMEKMKEAWNADLFSTTLEKNIAKMEEAGNAQKKIATGISAAEQRELDKRAKAQEKAAKEALKTAKWLADQHAKIDNDEFERERQRDLKEFEERYARDVAAMRKQEKAQEDSDRKAWEATVKTIDKISEKAEALELEVKYWGMSKAAIEEYNLAIMEKNRLEMESQEGGASEDAMRQADQQIAAQKKLIAAIHSKDVVEAASKSAKESEKAYEKAWEQVGQSLSDEIMKGGFSAKEYLEKTFRTMVLRPTIMAAAGSLMGGAQAGQQAAGGNPLGQVAGSIASNAIGSYFGVGGIGGSLAAGAGWMTGATTFGGAMGAGASLIGTGTLGGVASGLGVMAGALGPIALGVYVLYKYFQSKKGGPKVEGSAGWDSSGLIGGMGNELDTNAAKAVQGLNSTYTRMATMLGAVRTNMQFGIGLSMDPRGDAPSMVQIRSEISEAVNRNAGRSEEELMKALAEASSTVMVEALRNSGLDSQVLAYFDKITVGMTDEAKLAAFEQVAAVSQYWKQLQSMSGVIRSFGNISLEAAVRIAELSGGLENLSANVSAYAKHFLTDTQQVTLTYQQIANELNSAGSGWYGFTEHVLRSYSKERFRQIVEGLNLAEEGDRMRYVALMKVAGAFAELKEAATAKALERYNDAMGTLKDAYEQQKDILTTTRDAMRSVTESFIDFNKSLMVDTTLSTLNPQQRFAELEEQYSNARTRAVAGGYKDEDVTRMQEAARALLQGGRDFYASGEGYDALFRMIHEDMTNAANTAGTRATVAEAQLTSLDRSVSHLIVIQDTLINMDAALREFLNARHDLYTLGYPHAEGLSRVPFNNYPALLHQDEMVLPQNESAFIRSLPDFSGELRALRQEVAALRKENRQDAGNTIGATFAATQHAAEVQSEATIRAARQRLYQSRTRPVLA